MSKLWTVLVVSCVAALTLVVASNVLSQNLGKAPLPPVICEGGACPEPTDMGLEASNARFIGAGGSDTNSGLTHTERWATIGRLNAETLPQGTDVYFLTDSDLDDDTVFDIRHDGDGASDPVIIDTYCLDGGKVPIPYDGRHADCGERAVISGINAIGTGYDHFRYKKIQITDHVSGAIIPWHPGWYMLLRSSVSTLDDKKTPVRYRWYEENTFDTQDEVQGAVIYVTWKDLEPQKGVFTMDVLKAEVDKLQSLNKRFWVRMKDGCRTKNPYKCMPVWAVQEGHVTQFERVASARLWEGAARERWKILLTAIDDAVGNEPHFEGITINKESAQGRCENVAASDPNACQYDVLYNTRNRVAGYKEIMRHADEVFENSSVVISLNFLQAVQNIQSILEVGLATGVGLGAPDGSPRCTPHTKVTKAPGDCISPGATYASQENQQYRPYQLMEQPNHIYQGKFPIHYSIEGSVLGVQNAVKEYSGTSPALLNKWFTEVVKPSHLSITRTKETYNTSQKQWLWDRTKTPTYGVVDYYTLEDLINKYPVSGWNPIGTACPESHRGLCWTDVD